MSSIFSDIFRDRHASRKTWTAIGLGAIGAVVLPELNHLFAFIRLHFLHRSKLSRYQHAIRNTLSAESKTGNGRAWALVTGASDGIGYGFVHQLASKSFNVILHGRNETKIKSLIDKLRKEFPDLEFESFICDATDREAWSSAFDGLLTMLKQQSMNLTVLVNNVGGNPDHPKTFECLANYKYDHLNALVDMNAVFPAQITRVLLPTLISNKPGLVINMSSMAGYLPLPFLCGYSAGKAFNRHFSKTLRMEMIAEGHPEIEVLSILAASVQSAGMAVETSLVVPSSDAFAGSVLRLVGCGKEEIAGWWSHAVQMWFIGTLMPVWLRERILVKTMNETRSTLNLQKTDVVKATIVS